MAPKHFSNDKLQSTDFFKTILGQQGGGFLEIRTFPGPRQFFFPIPPELNKAAALTSSLKDLLKELQGTLRFTCDRCGRRLSIDLSLLDLGLLLGGEAIDITCTTCLDPAPSPFILSTVWHKVVGLKHGRAP